MAENDYSIKYTDENEKNAQNYLLEFDYSLEECQRYNFNNWHEVLYKLGDKRLSPINVKGESYISKVLNLPSVNVNYRLLERGGAIWLTTKGEIVYRLERTSKPIISSSFSNVEFILAAYLNQNIEITKLYKEQNHNTDITKLILYVQFILIVDGEKFDPYQKDEFFKNKEESEKKIYFEEADTSIVRDIFYRNSFKPSDFLLLDPKDYPYLPYNFSIIMQYLFHISNYKPDRFQYIVNWLANFFKNLKNKSNIPLVLVGKQNSGKELLFDEIIRPLFDKEYCIKITNYNLDVHKHQNLIKERLFYCLSNLSEKSIKKQKNNDFLSNLTSENSVFFESNTSVNEIELYGQLLITTNDSTSLTYLNSDNVSLFYVPDNIEDIYIPSFLNLKNKTLKEAIQDDLENFACLLKYSKTDNKTAQKKFKYDDFDQLNEDSDDKFQCFHDQLCCETSRNNMLKKLDDSFAQELKKDFDKRQIKQKVLLDLFKKLYPNEDISSSRTLMKSLRKIDENFYSTEVLKNGENGLKYFSLPKESN